MNASIALPKVDHYGPEVTLAPEVWIPTTGLGVHEAREKEAAVAAMYGDRVDSWEFDQRTDDGETFTVMHLKLRDTVVSAERLKDEQ